MEEMSSRGAPGAYDQGVWLAGPALMHEGTKEQQDRWLPGLREGTSRFCQLFSEPGAGSDLASLQSSAIRDGDEYVLNGQKIWTSWATGAKWGILLARTDPDAPKHRGISYFILDIESPGVSVRPLVNMMDAAHFNEVFFDDVRIPIDNRIGEENRGWYVAAATLDQERSSINRIVMTRSTLEALVDYVRERDGGSTSHHIRHELASRAIDFELGRWLCYRVAQMQSEGENPNYEASISKVFGTELQRQMGQTGMRVLGMEGLARAGQPVRPAAGARRALGAGGPELHGGRRHERGEPQHHRDPGPGSAALVGNLR